MTLENLDNMGFQLNLKVTGVTNPTFLSISYMAIAPGGVFPYYVNTFVDVPLGYYNPLVNIFLIRLISHRPQPAFNIIHKP